MSRETIHYTVELLMNGNVNIYRGDSCTQRNLAWENISPAGAVEVIGGWIVTWSDNEKDKRDK